ncbi:IBR finger domain protein [Metarhizium anisopliae]
MAYPIDNASLDLILRLQLEDAEGLLRGKHAIGEEPDVEFAAQLFKNDLEQLQTFISDNIMSRSIAQATMMDGDAIQASIDEEQQATYDREYATNFDSTNNPPRTYSSVPLIDDEMMGKLAVLFVGAGDLTTHAAHAESSSQERKQASCVQTTILDTVPAAKRMSRTLTRYVAPVPMIIVALVSLGCSRLR